MRGKATLWSAVALSYRFSMATKSPLRGDRKAVAERYRTPKRKVRNVRNIIWAVLVSMVLVACGGKTVETSGPIEGTVAESFDSAGFTYLRVQTAKGDEWVVVSPVSVKKGEKVAIEVTMTAEKFESKSLGRTFDRVTFGRVIRGATPVAAAMNHPSMPADHPAMMMPSPQMPETSAPIDVAKAEAANGKRVAEIWASKTRLENTEVAVRGKVVKFLPGIMGRNWIHLRDGSGSRAKGDDDLTVTTDAVVAKGDVVLVTGFVRVDKDFGSGRSEERRVGKECRSRWSPYH